MNDKLKKPLIKHDNGQPCKHRGCLNHISHPCESCGRIGGNGIVYFDDDAEMYSKGHVERRIGGAPGVNLKGGKK